MSEDHDMLMMIKNFTCEDEKWIVSAVFTFKWCYCYTCVITLVL